MASSSDTRIIEGLKHIDKADKYLKKTLFKWSADNDSAADEYNKAAICFLNAQAFEECKNAYKRAADCYTKAHVPLSAAKCYEHIAGVHKELNEWHECYDVICKAADIQRTEATGGSRAAFMTLTKGAKMLERSSIPDKAAELLMKALEIALSDDDMHEAIEIHGKIATIYVRLARYFDATYHLNKQLDLVLKENRSLEDIGRIAVNIVVVNLAREDPVSAEAALNQACGNNEFAGSRYCDLCLKLIRAYEEDDGSESLKLLQTTNPIIKNLDNDYLILARKLKSAYDIDRSGAERVSPRRKMSSAKVAALAAGDLINNPDIHAYAEKKKSLEKDVEDNDFSKIKLAEQLQKRLSVHQQEGLSPTSPKSTGSNLSSPPINSSNHAIMRNTTPTSISQISSSTSPLTSSTSNNEQMKNLSVKKKDKLASPKPSTPTSSSTNSRSFKDKSSDMSSPTDHSVQKKSASHSHKSTSKSFTSPHKASRNETRNLSPTKSSPYESSDNKRSPSRNSPFKDEEETTLKDISNFHASFKKVSRASLRSHSQKSSRSGREESPPPIIEDKAIATPHVDPHFVPERKDSSFKGRARKESVTNEGELLIEYEGFEDKRDFEIPHSFEDNNTSNLTEGLVNKSNSPRFSPTKSFPLKSPAVPDAIKPNEDLVITEIAPPIKPNYDMNHTSNIPRGNFQNLPRDDSEIDLR